MTITTTGTGAQVTARQLLLLRGGYLFMALGLALVKWPLLGEASSLPLYEGVTLAMLTAMSLLALLGLRDPLRMLPVLLFEVIWKGCGSPWWRCHWPSAMVSRPPRSRCSSTARSWS